MACMEHVCRQCNHMEFNNNSIMLVCPKCGSMDVMSSSDEEYDYQDDDRDDGRDYDREYEEDYDEDDA